MRGLVALVLLAVLDRSPEDLYGYEIAPGARHRAGTRTAGESATGRAGRLS